MEKQQKELLNFLDMHIECTRGLGKDFREDLIMFQALRRLVEKFYGEWQGMAQGAIKEYWIDNELANTISYKLSKEIRDFDPMAAEDKEKIKVEVQ